MIQTASLVQRNPSRNCRGRSESSVSGSSSSANHDVPRTPLDTFFARDRVELGDNFSTLKLQPSFIHQSRDYMRPQTTSPIPPWLVNTLSSLDAHHPLRALVPEGRLQRTEDVLRQPTTTMLSSCRQPAKEDEVFAFRPPTSSTPLLSEPRGMPTSIDHAVSIFNTDITPGVLPFGGQRTPPSQYIVPPRHPPICDRQSMSSSPGGTERQLQLSTNYEDSVPFSRPGPVFTRHPHHQRDLHVHFAPNVQMDTEDDALEYFLSSSPASNPHNGNVLMTPPNEVEGDRLNAPSETFSDSNFTSPPSLHIAYISPAQISPEDQTFSDSLTKPEYELDLDYESLDFKWERFSRDKSLVPVHPALDNESLGGFDIPDLDEGSYTIGEPCEVVESVDMNSSDQNLFPFVSPSQLTLGEVPVTPNTSFNHLRPNDATKSTNEVTPHTPVAQRASSTSLQPDLSETAPKSTITSLEAYVSPRPKKPLRTPNHPDSQPLSVPLEPHWTQVCTGRAESWV